MTLSSTSVGASPAIENEEAKIEPTYSSGDVPVHSNEREEKSLRAASDGGDHELPVFHSISIKRKKINNRRQMSFRRIMSLIAMAFLWTGSQIPIYLFGMKSQGDFRSWCFDLMIRCYPSLYLWRHWRRRSMDLVCMMYRVHSDSRLVSKSVPGSCESPGPCGNLPIRWVALRFARSPICGTNRCIFHHTWLYYIIDRTNHEYLHMQVNREPLSLTEAEANIGRICRRHGLVRCRRGHRRTHGIGSHL